jgi:hypothetical protein
MWWMPFLNSRRPSLRGSGLLALGALSGVVFTWSSTSSAHLVLLEPPSWVVEDSLGNPQKEAPCGGSGSDVSPSELVSTYRAGSIITVRWQETVGHPGHFRISLAKDRKDLVDPPVLTTAADGATGVSISADIEDPPSYPVLMDGLFPRAVAYAAQTDPFVQQVQLPNEPCENCTLQVTQFMANHVPGFFYHHCADVQIVTAADDVPDADIGPAGETVIAELSAQPATSLPTSESDAPASSGKSGGCSLATPGRGALTAPTTRAVPFAMLLLGLGAVLRRRRS